MRKNGQFRSSSPINEVEHFLESQFLHIHVRNRYLKNSIKTRFQEVYNSARAKKLLCTLSHICGYMSNPPVKNSGLENWSHELNLALCRQLWLSVFSVTLCPAFCSAFSDKFGDQLIVLGNTGEEIGRHNAAMNLSFGTIRSSRFAPRPEHCSTNPTLEEEPVDPVLPLWSSGKNPAVFGSVVCSLQAAAFGN